MGDALLAPMPKALVRSHSEFVERTVTTPSGAKIKVAKATARGGVHYRVTIDGKLHDTALTVSRANAIVRDLWQTHGRLL